VKHSWHVNEQEEEALLE